MATTISKRQFFEEHMRYVAAQDIDTMVQQTYTDDAVLYHNFPYFDGSPPYIHQGKEEIIQAQRTIFDPRNHGAIEAGTPFNFIEGDDFIFFQIPIKTPDKGNWINTDFWTIRDNKLAYQFVFGYPVSTPSMIHQFIFAHAKPGMSEREFQDYWINIHAVQYASKIPQIKRYMIDSRIPFEPEPEDPLFHGITSVLASFLRQKNLHNLL